MYTNLLLLLPFVAAFDQSKYPSPDLGIHLKKKLRIGKIINFQLVPSANSKWTEAVLKKIQDVGPVDEGCVAPGTWAPTLDDGPSTNTSITLKALADRQKKTTYFVVGSQIYRNPDVLRNIYQQGHQIALHSWAHSDMTKLTDGQIIADVIWNIKIINEILGITPRIMRLPYGAINDRIRQILTAMGIRIVQWNYNPDDYRYSFFPAQPTDANSQYPAGTTPERIVTGFAQAATNPQAKMISVQ